MIRISISKDPLPPHTRMNWLETILRRKSKGISYPDVLVRIALTPPHTHSIRSGLTPLPWCGVIFGNVPFTKLYAMESGRTETNDAHQIFSTVPITSEAYKLHRIYK